MTFTHKDISFKKKVTEGNILVSTQRDPLLSTTPSTSFNSVSLSLFREDNCINFLLR